jgi:hypothetical protein
LEGFLLKKCLSCVVGSFFEKFRSKSALIDTRTLLFAQLIPDSLNVPIIVIGD